MLDPYQITQTQIDAQRQVNFDPGYRELKSNSKNEIFFVSSQKHRYHSQRNTTTHLSTYPILKMKKRPSIWSHNDTIRNKLFFESNSDSFLVQQEVGHYYWRFTKAYGLANAAKEPIDDTNHKVFHCFHPFQKMTGRLDDKISVFKRLKNNELFSFSNLCKCRRGTHVPLILRNFSPNKLGSI